MATQKWFFTTAAPTTTPLNSGDFTLDITNKQAYVSLGTSSPSDWQLIPINAAVPGLYRTLYIDAGAMVGRTTGGAETGTAESTTNLIMNDFFDFDASTDEFAQFKVMLPDEWDRSTIKVKFFWTDGATAGTGDVVWAIQAGAISDDDAIDTALGTAVTITDTFISTGDMHITDATGALTVGGTPELEDMIYFQVYRDADAGGDTYDQDARLLGVAIQYREGTTVPVIW